MPNILPADISRIETKKGMPIIFYSDFGKNAASNIEHKGLDAPSDEFLQAMDALKPALIEDLALDPTQWASGKVWMVKIENGKEIDTIQIYGYLQKDGGPEVKLASRKLNLEDFTWQVSLDNLLSRAVGYVAGGERAQRSLFDATEPPRPALTLIHGDRVPTLESQEEPA